MRSIIKHKFQFLLLPVVYCLFVSSCTQIDIFEKNTAIPKYEWQQSFTAKGDFVISDTTSAYSIYLVLRHTDAYKYNNIWLNIGLQPPGDSMHIQKVNIALGDDANGWEGTGMNDIWEVRKLLNGAPRRFKQPGNYSFSISQIMRDNPLRHIMSVGLRIEKQKD
ncbi:MAG: gliding motility lipoprotein GldH [Chitinophagaceae bacterium]|nr:gliding motility lipoprotein GldH [Chitinophagaceae bacterium]